MLEGFGLHPGSYCAPFSTSLRLPIFCTLPLFTHVVFHPRASSSVPHLHSSLFNLTLLVLVAFEGRATDTIQLAAAVFRQSPFDRHLCVVIHIPHTVISPQHPSCWSNSLRFFYSHSDPVTIWESALIMTTESGAMLPGPAANVCSPPIWVACSNSREPMSPMTLECQPVRAFVPVSVDWWMLWFFTKAGGAKDPSSTL